MYKWIYRRITVLFFFPLQGTILRRWKKNWFDLWSDGRLVFYNDQQRRDMEDDIHMRMDCINIRNSAACHGMCHSKLPCFSALQYWYRMYYKVGSPHLTCDVPQSWTHQKGRSVTLCSRSFAEMDESSACVRTVLTMPCKTHTDTDTHPHTYPVEQFLKIILHNSTACRAWTMALQEARINTVSVNWLFCFVR